MTNSDFQPELSKIDNFIDKIGIIASADGKITSEEKALLDEIMEDLSDYRILVMDVLDDGVVTKDEEFEMDELKDSILRHINEIALADGYLSEDEKTLIETLTSFFDN